MESDNSSSPSPQLLYEIESEGLDVNHPRWSLENYIHELKSPLSKLFWSQEPEGFVLYRIIDSSEYEIINLALRNKGKGRAKYFLDSFLASLKLNYSTSITVWLELRESNLRALKLYTACKFELIGKRPHYYSNNEAAILMKLEY